MRTLGILAVVAALAATVPLVNAEYSYSALWAPAPSAYALTPAQDFEVFLNAGDVITATLDWSSDLPADVGLRVIPPGGSCTIYSLDLNDPTQSQGPDVDCIVTSTGNSIACASPNPDPALATGPLSRTVVASVSGAYKVSVSAELNTASTIYYSLGIDVNGATPTVNGPTGINYVNRGFFCKVLP